MILKPHPTSRYNDIYSVLVDVSKQQAGYLSLTYTLSANLEKLFIPEKKRSIAQDNLWQHTCFELFVKVQGESAYREFNFSPSTEWAAYGFSDYRQQQDWLAINSPSITSVIFGDQLKLSVQIALEDLAINPENKPLQLALTAVIEENNNNKSYWALEHPADQPDFHHKNGFTRII